MSNGSSRLYTPDILGLTLRLADFPWNDELALRGDARSPSCGSTLGLGLSCSADGAIAGLGLRVQACAIGQAAAAIFADAARGRTLSEIETSAKALALWLAREGAMPDWPGIAALEPAIAYPARHGAIMLPWKAAAQALSKRPDAR